MSKSLGCRLCQQHIAGCCMQAWLSRPHECLQDATVQLDAAVVSISLHHTEPSICVASFAVGSPSRIDFTTKNIRAVPTVLLGGLPLPCKDVKLPPFICVCMRESFSSLPCCECSYPALPGQVCVHRLSNSTYQANEVACPQAA